MARKKFGAGKIFTIGLIGTTGLLSVWQVNRFFWKRELIMQRMRIVNEPPNTVLPREHPKDLCMLRISGIMQNDEFIAVGPRKPIETAKGEIEKSQSVYTVYVPFLTREGDMLFVNRGQVPTSPLEDIRKTLYKWPCVGDITVMVREKGANAKYPSLPGDRVFPRPNAAAMWEHYKRDNEIKEGVTLLPYYADLLDWHDLPDQPFFPLGRDPRDYVDHQVMPLTHLSYCSTWTGAFVYGLYYLKNATSI
eukprot:TRINITY_DN17790_c0_g1_i1.p1 TRINITY_DN17790_c0_g1~~TRINITY_DN17790_c0_g1_i1.p1  ORF type:complete len:249 (+),score=28.31 TRINITY_DN17790_c0_g1_i1:43-789(+)